MKEQPPSYNLGHRTGPNNSARGDIKEMTANSSTFPSWLPSPALRQLRRLASEDVTQVTSVLMKAAQPLAHCNLELKQN